MSKERTEKAAEAQDAQITFKEIAQETDIKNVKNSNEEYKVSCPSKGIFYLIPRHQPELAGSITDVKWNMVAKNLCVIAKETPDMGVCRWMEYMNKRQKQIKEGPFVDLNDDALLLRMFDSQSHEVTRIKFKNLSLKNHSCVFENNEMENLQHEMLIEYQECDMSPDPEPENLKRATNELTDKEWQSANPTT